MVVDLASEPTNRNKSDPIQVGCSCYTCANYSVSYLFHLNEVKEMNYNILLAIHNLHALDRLFA